MIVFYSTDILGNYIYLKTDEHIHCSKVLRNQAGAIIKITDGNGHLYSCIIEKINREETICLIETKEEKSKSNFLTSIAISPLKNPVRLEWFVEKAVEIGISELYIFSSARTEKKTVNKERLKKIIVSAMKQSMNFYLPTFNIVSSFSELMEKCEKYQGKYFAWCENEPVLLKNVRDAQKNNIVIIGPEGDFTEDEAAYASTNGFTIVSLGESRLRTETAGLVALTMLK